MTTAAELLALQDVDLALDKAVSRLAQIEGALGESEELAEARARVTECRMRSDDLRSHQAELEWSVEEVQTKATAVESKLYGGSVTNAKELSDLQADLKSVQAHLRKREDALLALLVEIEDAEALLKDADAECAGVEAGWSLGQEELIAERDRLQPEAARLQSIRDNVATEIDRASLNLYRMLRERRGGQAAAKVERGMCQGCRISLPVSVMQKTRAGAGLVQCVSCERILVMG